MNYSGHEDLTSANTFMPHLFDPLGNRVAYVSSKDCIELDVDALFLSVSPGFHFGSWLINYLPRLRCWRKADGTPRKILVPRMLPPHLRDSLARFGIASSDVIPCDLGQRYRFKSLAVYRNDAFPRPHYANVRFLYEHLCPTKSPVVKKARQRRFYLERSGTARGRDIANKEAVATLLREFEFETIHRGEISIAEQESLMREAAVVLTPFGTDLFASFIVTGKQIGRAHV